MPLANQVAQTGGTIVITVPLQAIGPGPTFTVGAAGFNSGNPTATYTYTLPVTPQSERKIQGVGSALHPSMVTILQELDNMMAIDKGIVVVT